MQAEDHEWFIVFVSKATTDNAVKLSKRVYGRIEGDFSSKKRERYLSPNFLNLKFITATQCFSYLIVTSPVSLSLVIILRCQVSYSIAYSAFFRIRCCKVDLHGADNSVWEEIELKIVECIRNTLDRRVQHYEEEVRKLSENRFVPWWNFCNFFTVKVRNAYCNLSCGYRCFSRLL